MKRVAIFRSVVLPASETFIRDQALALRNWEPVLVGFRRPAVGLDLSRLRQEVAPPGSRMLFALRVMLGWPVPDLVRMLRRLEVQLVHVHFGTDAADIWPSVRAAGLPMLVTLHGYDVNTSSAWWESGHGGMRGRTYPRRLRQMADSPAVRFVAVSGAIMRRAMELGVPRERISVCHVGVDTERFQPGGVPLARRARRILFAGRMVEKKAPLFMVRAFARVRQRVPDAELAMIGDGPLLHAARRLAAELGVPVGFPGTCTPEEVAARLGEARVVCMPSITAPNGDAEGFGMVLLEAQGCGVPVVTSARGGGEEGLINGVTGDVFREGDLDAAVNLLARWLVDEDRATAASVAARQFVQQRFDIVQCTAMLENAYDSMTESRGAA